MPNPKDTIPGKKYKCTLLNCMTKETVIETLIRVDQDDCAWRTADDNSEIDYSWDVISAEPIEEYKISCKCDNPRCPCLYE